MSADEYQISMAGGDGERAAHNQCVDCGKCRVHPHEDDWCDVCKYFSCERGTDCADAEPERTP